MDENSFNARKSILIFDSDPTLVEYFANQCLAIGLDVASAHDLPNAAAALEARVPDLLMVDIAMSGGHGATFLECMAAYEDTRPIPAIVLCDNCDLRSVERIPTLCAYYATKSQDSWWRIKTFIYELIDLDPSLERTVAAPKKSTSNDTLTNGDPQ